MSNISHSTKQKNHRFPLSFISATILFSSPIYASGVLLQEAVVANAGTVGAGDGVYTESAAAMWANPATMSHMGASKTTVNAMLFDLQMDYTDKQDNGDARGHTTMPSLGAFHAHQLNEQWHAGIAIGTAGGSSLDYGADWAGSALMTDIALTTFQVNPALSYQLNDQLSLGVGAQFSWASLEMGMRSGNLSLDDSSDWAYGFNLGAMYRVNEQFDLGFSFRSKLDHEFSTSLTGQVGLNPSVSTDLSVPAIYDISARYAATDKLNLLTSIQLHRWSDWDQTAFEIGGQTAVVERDWDDVWKLAVALDYQLSTEWRLKTGFSYETSPQDDPNYQWVDLPVGEQYRYSIGAATQVGGYTIDMFYEYADFGDVDMYHDRLVTVDGTFSGQMHFIGMNVTF